MKKILREKSSRTTFFTVCIFMSWVGLLAYDSYIMSTGLTEYTKVYRNGGYSIFAIIFLPVFRWIYKVYIDKYVERMNSLSASASAIFASALLSFPLLYLFFSTIAFIAIQILSV